MAFTDHCDVFGSFHEEGFNRIIDHIRFQRPSMFNYATQAIADNPALLCQPIVAHPRLNQHGNPLVTIIDPLPLPGANFALNFSVQLVDVKIDFHPANVVTLPAELSPLGVQRFVISLRVCAGIGCPPAQASATTSRRRRIRTRIRTCRRLRRRPWSSCRRISS